MSQKNRVNIGKFVLAMNSPIYYMNFHVKEGAAEYNESHKFQQSL